MSKIAYGQPTPLGATRTATGINFAVYARHADRLRVVLFTDPAVTEGAEFDLDPAQHRTGGVWHIEIPAETLGDACYYAYRAWGPNSDVHRYDGDKLLLDPYARRVHFPPGHSREAASSPGSTFGCAPVGVLPIAEEVMFEWGDDVRPLHPANRRVIYELHVRGFTMRDPSVPAKHRGTYLGVVDKIPYLKSLGVTTVELMPIQQFDPKEKNYWGYMTLAFFAPHQGYAATDDADAELKTMVRALHAAGIEVLLDVVFNHTTEDDETGPTYSFRGLDNSTYYVPGTDGRIYNDDAGTGNVFRTAHPQVRRLVLDSLRYWTTTFRVDGFRYDLATLFTRDLWGRLDDNSALVPSIEHDPVLEPLLHVAEPWDLSAYQVGSSFPGASWSQWNDRFRDDIRRFVKSDQGLVPALMQRLSGNADLFAPHPPDSRLSAQSVNFIVAHDGFCLNDLVSYNHTHNEANGHHNQDGARVNHSWNCGHEGEVDAPPEVRKLRTRQRKNLLTLLLLANGVPMLYMGDEFGNTQGGNNNPYNQDNETTWLDWSRRNMHEDLHRFAQKLIAFRHRHRVLRGPRGWGRAVSWYGVDGGPDLAPNSHSLAFALHGADQTDCDLYVMINFYWDSLTFHVQEDRRGGWHKVIETMNASPSDIYDDDSAPVVTSRTVRVAPRSIVVLRSAGG